MLTEWELRNEALLNDQPELAYAMILGYLALSVVVTWGTVCMLTIGKRLLQAKAGRARTSFKAVRKAAGPFFIPVFLTGILRGIFTLLWALLLIVPGIIYSIRTVFYAVIVVCEGVSYREALMRSKDVVHGQFWNVLLSLAGFILIIILPVQILNAIIGAIAEEAPWSIVTAANTATALLTTLSLTLFPLCLIQLYGHFRPSTSPVSN